jgi:hypothetical protein
MLTPTKEKSYLARGPTSPALRRAWDSMCSRPYAIPSFLHLMREEEHHWGGRFLPSEIHAREQEISSIVSELFDLPRKSHDHARAYMHNHTLPPSRPPLLL